MGQTIKGDTPKTRKQQMKLPTTFLPEHKSLEQKTEQLLEEAKVIQEDTAYDKKEQAIQKLMNQFDCYQYYKPQELQLIIEEEIKKEGYIELTNNNSEVRYWAKNISALETKLFIRRGEYGYNLKEYGFASIRPENLGKFCEIFKSYEKEIRHKNHNLRHYSRSNYKKGGLIAAAIYGAFSCPVVISALQPPYTSTDLLMLGLLPLNLLVLYRAGGKLFDLCAHKIKNKRMRKLCTSFIEDEKLAIRRALE